MAGDPFYNNVSLLIHCDGANSSTTFTDTSPTPKTVTVVGNAQVSTAQSKFGGASARFDGAGGYLSLEGSTSCAFGTGDFTLEMWCYPLATGALQALIDFRATNGPKPLIYIASDNTLRYYVNTADRINAGVISANVWHHVAVCRSSGSTKMFIDGVHQGTSFADATDYTVDASRPIIGMTFDGFTLNGYLDEIRITKGVARYTSSFTPPALASPEVAVRVSGIVRDSTNAFCARTVRAYDRTTGALLGSTTSDAVTGVYNIDCSTNGEVNVICLDDTAGVTENDLILRTTPV